MRRLREKTVALTGEERERLISLLVAPSDEALRAKIESPSHRDLADCMFYAVDPDGNIHEARRQKVICVVFARRKGKGDWFDVAWFQSRRSAETQARRLPTGTIATAFRGWPK